MKVRDAGMVDVEAPEHGIDITIRDDGKVVWVNVDGKCLLRICQNTTPIEVNYSGEPPFQALIKGDK